MGITKRGGRFRAEVFRRSPQYESATFGTKREAELWIAQKKSDRAGVRLGLGADRPFSDALIRYRDTVSASKRGHHWERVRIGLFLRDPIANVKMRALDASHVADWRDRRIKQVSAESVRREWNLLSAAATVAVREWKWLKFNPFREVTRPPAGKPRTRLITQEEIDRMVIASGAPANTVAGRTVAAFLFALETGMRAGEVTSLTSVNGAVAFLPITKNGTSREVPLSQKALEIWAQYPQGFGLTTRQLDANFRKLKKMAGVEGFTFHDARHSAATRLANLRKPDGSHAIQVLDLCRMMGWKNVSEAMTYYNRPASDIAKDL